MPRVTPPDRRESILSAARAEFAERGYAGARIEDVAARVGISKAAVYLQFADKQALFREMIDWLLADNLPVPGPGMTLPGTAPEQLALLVRMASQRLGEGEITFLPRLIIGEGGNFPEIARTYHDRVIARVMGVIEAIIAGGIAAGVFRKVDPALAARTVAGGIVISALWRSVLEPAGAPPLDLGTMAESHIDLLLNGLVVKEPA